MKRVNKYLLKKKIKTENGEKKNDKFPIFKRKSGFGKKGFNKD